LAKLEGVVTFKSIEESRQAGASDREITQQLNLFGKNLASSVRAQEQTNQHLKEIKSDLRTAGRPGATGTSELAQSVDKLGTSVDKLTKAEEKIGTKIPQLKPSFIEPRGPTHRIPRLDKSLGEIDKVAVGLKKSLETLGIEIVAAAKASDAYKRGLIKFEEKQPKFERKGREFQLRAVDVRKMTKALESFGQKLTKQPAALKETEVAGLLKRLTQLTEESLRKTPSRDDMATALAQAFQRQTGRRFTAEQVKKKFEGDDLTAKYLANIVPTELKKAMREVVKIIAIPAVKTTAQGAKVIETKAGAQRSVGQFAQFERGFESLIKKLEQRQTGITKIGFENIKAEIIKELAKPSEGETVSKADLAEAFRPLLRELGATSPSELARAMASAIATQEAKAAGGKKAIDFEKRVGELSTQTMPQLKKAMDDLHLNAVDVVNTFAELKRLNIYDVISQSLKASTSGAGGAQQPFDVNFWQRVEKGQESAFRRFEKRINDIVELMPVTAPGRPKLGVHGGETVSVLTARPQIATGKPGQTPTLETPDQLLPAAAKAHIIGLNEEIRNLFKDLEATGQLSKFKESEKGFFDLLTTIGQSESIASDAKTRIDELNQAVFKMTAIDIRKLGPFGEQFANLGRSMAQAQQALSGLTTEFPTLRSQTEQGFVESGQFGRGGFGKNIVTEIRHTAQTFEDQIEISGRLAQVVTETARQLVLPGGPGVPEVTEKLVAESPLARAQQFIERGEAIPKEVLEEISKVGNEIIQAFGETRKYEFGADRAFIENVVQTAIAVRGDEQDVQIARIIEQFLAQWGRKFTTRFAAKGVSTFGVAGQAAAGGASVKIADDLGVAQMPKTLGELASEMFAGSQPELAKQLVAAGNKFFIDLFTEAEPQMAMLLDELNKALGTSFKPSPADIGKFKQLYLEKTGKGQEGLTKDVPIEARISAFGLAKRGLQADILEQFANNITGAVETVIPDKVEVEKWLGGEGVFARYFEALGFEQNVEEIARLQGEISKLEKKAVGLKEIEKTEVEARIAELEKLVELEKTYPAYSKVGDKLRLVGEKFLEIVEEPTLKKETTFAELQEGTKGQRVNLQAFAALTSIFGEQSAYIKELAETFSPAEKQARELLVALLAMSTQFKDLKGNFDALLPVLEAGGADIRSFREAAGSMEDIKGTLLDIAKFPESFLLNLPAGGGGGQVFVPGAAARGPFTEESTGAQIPTKLTRLLDNILIAAETLTEATTGKGELLDQEQIQKNINNAFQRVVAAIDKAIAKGDVGEARKIFDYLAKNLGPLLDFSYTKTPTAVKKSDLGGEQRAQLLKDVRTEFSRSKAPSEVVAELEGIRKATLDMKNELIGESPIKLTKNIEAFQKEIKALREAGKSPGGRQKDLGVEQAALKKTRGVTLLSEVDIVALGKALDTEVTKGVGQGLENAVENLAKARARYEEELATQIFGKKGVVQQAFFEKILPAQRAQVVSLETNKVNDLVRAAEAMKTIADRLPDAAQKALEKASQIPERNVQALEAVIRESITRQKAGREEGRPFLDEGEIAISVKKATELGILEALKKGKDVFVETLRFPVTGAPSFQPAKAKLMTEEEGFAGPQFTGAVIGLAGRPGYDVAQVAEDLEPLRGVAKALRDDLDDLNNEVVAGKKSEKDAAPIRAQLVGSLKELNAIIDKATAQFAPFEQNLDFDGDAIFVHAAKTKEAAKEVEKHYLALRSLGSDVNAVRQALFKTVNAIEEKNVETLAQIADVYGGRFPREKGFGFLEKPHIAEEIKGISEKELDNILAKYLTGEATDIGGALQMLSEKLGKPAEAISKAEKQQEVFNRKVAEDLTKQLTKIDVGMATESITRIARAAEVVVGSGGGVGGGGKPPYEGFGFKAGKLAGPDPVRHFQEMLNELLRFGINAALKTKHGGDPLYQDLAKFITTRFDDPKAFNKAFNELVKGEGFGGLKKASTAIADALADKMRALNFNELVEEAVLFGIKRGEAEKLDRAALTTKLIEKAGFRGFFRELQNSLKEAAIRAYEVQIKKEIDSGKLVTEADTPFDIRGAAEQRFAGKRKGPEGTTLPINVLEEITSILQPLYKLRTSQQGLPEAFGTGTAYAPGSLPVTPEQFAPEYVQRVVEQAELTGRDVNEKWVKTMGQVQVAADHLVGSVQDVTQGVTSSADAMTTMMDMFVKQSLSQIGRRERFATTAGIPTRPGDVDVQALEEKLLKAITSRLGGTSTDKIQKFMKEATERLGIPGLTKEEKLTAESEALANFEEVLAKSGIAIGELTNKEIETQQRSAVALEEFSVFVEKLVQSLAKVDFEKLALQTLTGAQRAEIGPVTVADPRQRELMPGGARGGDKLDINKLLEEAAKERKEQLEEAFGPGGGTTGGGGDEPPGDEMERLKQSFNATQQRFKDLMSQAESQKGIEAFDEALDKLQEAMNELDRFSDKAEKMKASAPDSSVLRSMEAVIERSYKNTADLIIAIENVRDSIPEIEKVSGLGMDFEVTGDPLVDLRQYQTFARDVNLNYNKMFVDLPKRAQDILKKLETEGQQGYKKAPAEFRDAIKSANVSGAKELDAWKLYHLAKVEYLISEAERWKKEADKLKSAGEPRKASEAFAQARSALEEAQKSAIATLPKRKTTPYLTGGPHGAASRYFSTPLAESAGISIGDEEALRASQQEYKEVRPGGELARSFQLATSPEKVDFGGKNLPKNLASLQKLVLIFDDLTMANKEIIEQGEQLQQAWDFQRLARNVTILRGAVEQYLFNNIKLTETQRQNLREVISLLKDLEKQYGKVGGAALQQGLVKIPKWLDPEQQAALHKRNLQILKKQFGTPLAEIGAEMGSYEKAIEMIGESTNYTMKIFDQTGQVLTNKVFQFERLADAVTSTGEKIGRFRLQVDDMNQAFQERRGIGQAFRRVIMWGGAAAVVYGTIQALRDMVDVIADVESQMAQLRKVMNPVTTDFMMIQRAGVEMAKEFGVPIEQVVDAMRVFAQQGLAQQEVLDRTRISTLAANVTTLEAAEATEALTAAVKVYDTQGRGTVKFLDSWLEVESKHAITSRDLALALQRAGAAAKNAGIDFDELNAIVTGIGVTTRQTGKEIGTSVRFIARRLTSAKAPAELAKIGIAAFGETGDIRSAFAIMDDLAMKWESLTQAMRLNISMAIGGRRHYNSILVLMDNWDEVTSALMHSQNSQGASMQRNQIIMEQFRKKMTQLAETVKQTQLLFGEFALKHAKTLIDATRVLVQAVNDIPPVMKKAAVGIAATFVLLHKGATLIDRFADGWSGLVTTIGGFKPGATGKGFIGDILKVLGGARTAKSIFEIESSLGKLWFTILDLGRSFNKFIAGLLGSVAKFSLWKSAILAVVGAASALTGVLAPLSPILLNMSKSGLISAGGFSALALGMSKLGDAGTGVIGSLGPLTATIYGLYKVLGPLYRRFKESNQSAIDFAESQKLPILALQTEAKEIKNHIATLETLRKKRDELGGPSELPAQVARETNLLEQVKMARTFGDAVGKVLPEAVTGFDKYGRAILASTEHLDLNLKSLGLLYDAMQRMAQLDIADKAVHDLTAVNEGMERFKKVLRDTLQTIPLVGKALSKGIKVAPIIDLSETRAEFADLSKRRAETPFSVVYDKPIEDARKRIKELRTTIASTIRVIQESLAAAPMGDTLQDITANLQEWKREFEVLADYMSSDKISFAWEDLLAAEAFRREGAKIKESGESTYAYLKSLGFKIKENQTDIAARFKEEGKSLTQAIEEGLVDPLQFTGVAGDIVLFDRDQAKRFDVAAGAARLAFDDAGDAMIEFIRKTTGDWAKEDFSDEMQKFALAIFSPTDFQRAVEKGIKQINAVISGAAAGIAYPAPVDLGARFFSQIPTEQLLASGFGTTTTPATGEAPTFGKPESKKDFELEYDRYLKTLREYKISQEALTKTQQDALNIGAKVAPEVMQRFLDLQQVLLNESAVMNYKAVIVDLNKAFEEGSRNLQTALRQAQMAAEFDVFQTGTLAGRQMELPSTPLPPVGVSELNIQQFAQLVSPDYGKLINQLNVANLQRKEQLARMDKAAQAQDDLKYLEDLYLAQGSIIQQKDFAEFSDFLQQTEDKNAQLILTQLMSIDSHVKRTAENTGLTAGVAAEDVQQIELTDATVAKIAQYGFGAIAKSRTSDAFQLPAELMVGVGDSVAEAASLFDSAVIQLAQMDPSEIMSRYREEVDKLGNVPGFKTEQGTESENALTEMFSSAFAKAIGPQYAGGEGLGKLLELVEKETPPEKREFIDTGLPVADFAVGPYADSIRTVNKEHLDDLAAENARSAFGFRKLTTQLGAVILSSFTQGGSKAAGALLFGAAGGEIGEALGSGAGAKKLTVQVLTALVGSKIAGAFKEGNKLTAEQAEKVREAIESGDIESAAQIKEALARPEGQSVEGFDQLLGETSLQTQYLKILADDVAKGGDAQAKKDLKDAEDIRATVDAIKIQGTFRKDVFTILKKSALLFTTAAAAGIVAEAAYRERLPGQEAEIAKSQQQGVFKYLAQREQTTLSSIKTLDDAAKSLRKRARAIAEFKGVNIERQFTDAEEALIKSLNETADLYNNSANEIRALSDYIGRLQLSALAVHVKLELQRQLDAFVDNLRMEDEAERLRDRFAGELSGFLQGFKLPGSIEPGRPAALATPQERTFARMPELYKGFFDLERKRQGILAQLDATSKQLIKTESDLATAKAAGAKNTDTLRVKEQTLANTKMALATQAENLTGTLEKLKDALDQQVLIEQLRSSIENMLFDLKKSADLIYDTTSVDKATGTHPLAEVTAEWGDVAAGIFRQGMDKFELEIARIQKEKGFVPTEDRQRIGFQRKEELILRERAKEQEKLKSEVGTAEGILSELYEYQNKWGLDVQSLMDQVRSGLESAGEVRRGAGGRAEFRGIPEIDRLSERLQELAERAKTEEYKLMADIALAETNHWLQAITSNTEAMKKMFGQIGKNLSSAKTQYGERVAEVRGADEKITSGDVRAIIEMTKRQPGHASLAGKPYYGPGGKPKEEETDIYGNFLQAGGTISGPGGIDKVPAMLTAGEYVIRKESVDKLRKQYGDGVLERLNKKGEIPGFQHGGPVDEKLHSSARKPGEKEEEGRLSLVSDKGVAPDDIYAQDYKYKSNIFQMQTSKKEYIKQRMDETARQKAPEVNPMDDPKLKARTQKYHETMKKYGFARADRFGTLLPDELQGPDITADQIIAYQQTSRKQKPSSLAEQLEIATAERTPRTPTVRQLEVFLDLLDTEGPERALQMLFGITAGATFPRTMTQTSTTTQDIGNVTRALNLIGGGNYQLFEKFYNELTDKEAKEFSKRAKFELFGADSQYNSLSMISKAMEAYKKGDTKFFQTVMKDIRPKDRAEVERRIGGGFELYGERPSKKQDLRFAPSQSGANFPLSTTFMRKPIDMMGFYGTGVAGLFPEERSEQDFAPELFGPRQFGGMIKKFDDGGGAEKLSFIEKMRRKIVGKDAAQRIETGMAGPAQPAADKKSPLMQYLNDLKVTEGFDPNAFLTDPEIAEAIKELGLNTQKVQTHIDNSLTQGLTADDIVSMDQDVYDALFRSGGMIKKYQDGGQVDTSASDWLRRTLLGEEAAQRIEGTAGADQPPVDARSSLVKYIQDLTETQGFDPMAFLTDPEIAEVVKTLGLNAQKVQDHINQSLTLGLTADDIVSMDDATFDTLYRLGGLVGFQSGGKAQKVPAYGRGSKFIPSNQLAYLHGGEAVIPASMNLGGQAFQGGGAVERMEIDEEAITNAIKAGIEAATVTAELQDNVVRLEDNRVELDPAAFTGLKESINTAVGTGLSNVDGRVANLEGKATGWTEATKAHGEAISKLKFEDLPALKIETKSEIHDKTEVLRTELKNSDAEVGAQFSIYDSRMTAQEREIILAKSDINATKGDLSNVGSKVDQATAELRRRS